MKFAAVVKQYSDIRTFRTQSLTHSSRNDGL